MTVHPKAVAEHRDLIIKCLDDLDMTIRLRALDLLTGMVDTPHMVLGHVTYCFKGNEEEHPRHYEAAPGVHRQG